MKLLNPDFWRDRPVLVTGATGLQGGWLVKSLLDLEADVVCLVRDWVPQSQLYSTAMIDRVRVVRGDIVDRDLMERVMGEYEVRTVFHLAAQTIVSIANRNPVSTFEANVQGTWNVLEAARRSPRIEQVVIASSDKAYGSHDVLPYREDHPLRGLHPYDVSKSCADLISTAYAHTYGTPTIISRFGNLYGGGDLNWNRIVPGTIRSIIRGERPIIRSDGTMIRDYFYVEDGAEAYMLLAEKLAADTALAGRAFNFSTGKPMAVTEIVAAITAVFGSELEPEILNQASNEIPDQHLDSTLARELLRWEPTFGLDEGLARTAAWYRAYFERQRAS